MMREQGGPRREEAVQGEAVSEKVMCGAAAEHETDGGLWRRQMGCPVGVEGGPVWG